MKKEVVIIGAGIAGVQAATTLSADSQINVTLINGESFAPYYRMRLEEVVKGNEPSSIFIHPESWYGEKGISLVKARVTAINREDRSISLEDGSSLHYDKLIISTGAHANILKVEGEERELPLRNMEDALLIRQRLERTKPNVAVIGGGLLGLELASAIAEKYHVSVAVLERGEHILPLQLDVASSLEVKRYLEGRGITIVTGVNVASIREGVVLLDNGSEIRAELVLASLGVHVDTELFKRAGLEVGRAIRVNRGLQTNDGDIYALGDCAELDGHFFSLALFARDMGLFVAKEIREGTLSSYQIPSPASALKIAGMDVAFFGSREGSEHVIKRGESRITLFVKDDILVGAVLLNAKAQMIKIKNSIGKIFDLKSYEDIKE